MLNLAVILHGVWQDCVLPHVPAVASSCLLLSRPTGRPGLTQAPKVAEREKTPKVAEREKMTKRRASPPTSSTRVTR